MAGMLAEFAKNAVLAETLVELAEYADVAEMLAELAKTADLAEILTELAGEGRLGQDARRACYWIAGMCWDLRRSTQTLKMGSGSSLGEPLAEVKRRRRRQREHPWLCPLCGEG